MSQSKRGFAAMDPAKQREIASKGGKAAHQKGTAHEFSREEARVAGRKGGEVVSRDREHMAAIGRAGGVAVSRDREHMSRIGREGGEARGARARKERVERVVEAARAGDEPTADHDPQR